MPTSPSIWVVDTSVLIDFHHGEILLIIFKFGQQVVAPDVIIAELHEPNGQYLCNNGLQSRELDAEQVSEVMHLAQKYRSISVNDLFALVLAKSIGGVLLTSDKHLRKAAFDLGVEVHGTLWLLDRAIEADVLACHEAAAALQRMLKAERRLPQRECEARLRQWQAADR
jgi:predicted nucleic acid-binding protein